MFSTSTATRKSAFTAVKGNTAQRLNYEGDLKTAKNPLLGFNISFDAKTGMPVGVTTPQTKKAFCKVCHDAGKPESIYTSHFVRAAPSPDAPVVCPTLLAQPCRYCGIAGHTVKYCPGLQQVPTLSNQQEFQANFVKQAKQLKQHIAKNEMIRSANAYAALAADESSSDEDETQSGRSSPDYSPSKENKYNGSNALLELYGNLNVLSRHSILSILQVLTPFKQTNNFDVVQLCYCLENALSKKKEERAPFCSPLPAPNKPIIAETITTQKKDWADCDDDEEMDFNTTLAFPDFPPLPPATAVKPTYAQMAKQGEQCYP